MRLFQALILDEHLEGTAFYESSYAWGFLLARAEALKFICVADQVTGTPTLTISLSGGNMGDSGETTKLNLISGGLAAGTNLLTGTYSAADTTFPPPRHLIVDASLSGNTAHVRLWVCGRGPQLLEAIPQASASLSAQAAAARMLADEDRLPLNKRVLRQGQSAFFPPELLLPSLKWER